MATKPKEINVTPPKPGEPGYLRSLDQPESAPAAIQPRSVALAPVAANQMATLDREQIALLKEMFLKDATDAELKLFTQVCNRTGLDPFSKQIYPIKRWSSEAKKEVMGIQVGIDGFRSIASRTGEYEGQTEPQWCGEDGVWVNVWLKTTPPAAARIGVWRRGFREPVFGIALFKSYKQVKRDGTLTSFWLKMGELMLSKVAEALALRKAFPFELSGLYTGDEMAQASKPESNQTETVEVAGTVIDAEVVADTAVARPAMRSDQPELRRPQKKASNLEMQPVAKPEPAIQHDYCDECGCAGGHTHKCSHYDEPAGERPAFEGMPKEIVADEKSGQVLPANFDPKKVYNIETCPASAPRITREAAMKLYGAAKDAGMPDYRENVGKLITLKTGFSRPGEVPAFATFEKLLAYFKSDNWKKDIAK